SNGYLKKFYHFMINKKRIKIYNKYVKLFAIDPNLIFLESYQGRNFSCSPKALYNEMINDPQYTNFKFIISLRNPSDDIIDYYDNDKTTIVKYRSDEYYQYLATAKYWISNAILDLAIYKRKNQKYLQTWHGTPLKVIGFDISNTNNIMQNVEMTKKNYEKEAKRIDMMPSPSSYYTKHIITGFNLKTYHKVDIVKELGYPRNDRLFNYQEHDINELKKQFNIPLDKKIILYCPTWRDSNYTFGTGYTYDINLDLNKLRELYQDDYVFVFRLHYLISNKINLSVYEGFIYDLSDVNDINDVLLIADALITDYSSIIFDYANLKRPMIFYMYDYDEYINETRGLYFDISHDLPGKIVKNENELFKEINDLNNWHHEYGKLMKSFNNTFNTYEDGKSTKRLLDDFFQNFK
ncbi:MAG: CDP-glycerol glycerophosphotransferase family protein, partial [Bacilli bacterium]|nr:CDP-glycerol glycerophosphotransferase family protein [Bacilli bacterium]